jgi:HSP20 family protein
MFVPWFDVDAAVAEMNAVSRQMNALLGQRDRHGLRSSDAQIDLGVREDDAGWVLTADLPGVAPDAVSVTYGDGALTVRAERKWAPPEDATVRVAERRSFAVNRELRLPDLVDADQIAASFELGVLTVRLPKRPQARPRSVPVLTA